MKRIWRVTQRGFIDSAFNGEGARSEGGRWNSVGTPLVYTSENLSLAVLETLIHLKFAEALSLYVAIPADVDERLIEQHLDSTLPTDWEKDPAPLALQTIGDQWCWAKRSLVLSVPSAVVTVENNYLINPLHPDFKTLKIGEPVDLPIDTRLLEKIKLA